MKITYLKLVNVAGLMVGSGIDTLEIDLSQSHNNIVAIVAPNASGKSVLLSSLSPFANVTSIDERSSLSYIIPKKNGYKEIHYQDEENTYVIKHYYKATDKSHTIKSYFSLNGEELNENGNVRSFIPLVEIHIGLTVDMMRLIRLGTNVSSIISLAPAARKEYIGKLIDEIDIYLHIYKEINDGIKVVKSLISSNDINLYNCHISDIVVEEDRLTKLEKEIKSLEKEKDKIISKLAAIKSLMQSNDIDDLKRKKHEAETSISEFQKVESAIHDNKLDGVSIDKLTIKRSDIVSSKIDIQAKINSYRMSIDSALQNIEKLEVSVNKITSNNDIRSLIDLIKSLRQSVNSTNPIIVNFNAPDGVTSEVVGNIISSLTSFNVISQTIRTFGNKPSEVYLKLRRSKVTIDDWLKEQAKKTGSGIKESDLKILYDKVFQDESIITPNCEWEFNECPYYRFAEALDSMQRDIDESFDPETLRYIQVISRNIDMIMNEVDMMRKLRLPDKLRDCLREDSVLSRLGDQLPFFDVSSFQEYLMIVKASEIYRQDCEKLKQYEYQLSIYRKSGIDGQMDEIKTLRENIEFYKNNINTLNGRISEINTQLETIDNQISLLSRYNDSKKYRKIFESTLQSTIKILEPLEQAEHEKMELKYELDRATANLESARDSHKQLERKINEYKRLVKEGEELAEKHRDLKIILSATSTKRGIPVTYMKRYLGKIKNLANNLLSLIYGDSFKLGKFHITQDAFEIPYVKNGTKVSDVKYSSQSEIAMSTIALSFALSNRATGRYNIPLLDEVDSGLDERNRLSFLKLFDAQMRALNAEQSFVISQNLSQMVNIPMDVIMLGDTGSPRSKLQNVIYERG